jgi:hypothetical protein
MLMSNLLLKALVPSAKNATLDCIYDSFMHRRRSHVEFTCRETFTNGTRQRLTIEAEKIYVMIRRRLLWCPVYKASHDSTSYLLSFRNDSQGASEIGH